MPNQDEQDYKDYQDYLEYQKHIAGSQAAAPSQKDPGFSWSQVGHNLMDPNYHIADKFKEATQVSPEEADAKVKGSKSVGDPGAMGLAMPAESAPAGLAKLVAFLGKSAPARIAANTVSGAAQGAMSAEPGSRMDAAKRGALFGGAISGIGEGIGALGSLGKNVGAKFARMNPSQADAYASDPAGVKAMAGMMEDPLKTPELQDQAAEAIQNSRRALRAQGLGKAKELAGALQGKQVNIDPSAFQGHSDDADALIQGLMSQKPPQEASQAFSELAGTTPKDSPFPVDANQANDLKRALQKASEFGRGTPIDPIQAAKNTQAAQAAARLRSSLEGLGENVQPLNKDMQESVLLQEALRKGLRSPLSFVKTEAPDRVATLARAENRGAGGLLDFGNKLGAAGTMVSKDVGSGIPSFPVKAAGRAGIRLGDTVENLGDKASAASPFFTQALLQGLFNNDKK